MPGSRRLIRRHMRALGTREGAPRGRCRLGPVAGRAECHIMELDDYWSERYATACSLPTRPPRALMRGVRRHPWLAATNRSRIKPPASPPPLAQPLARVAARAEDARVSRQWLATEDEWDGMVGRQVGHHVPHDASLGRSSRGARPTPRRSASPAGARPTSAESDGQASGGSGWRSPGGRNGRSGARSSSASRRPLRGYRSPGRRKPVSGPSMTVRPSRPSPRCRRVAAHLGPRAAQDSTSA
jgi:hypothetical protein